MLRLQITLQQKAEERRYLHHLNSIQDFQSVTSQNGAMAEQKGEASLKPKPSGFLRDVPGIRRGAGKPCRTPLIMAKRCAALLLTTAQVTGLWSRFTGREIKLRAVQGRTEGREGG